MILEIFAEQPSLVEGGLAVSVIGWFMLRYEKRSDVADKKADVMIEELRAVKHGQHGVQRAMLIMEINRTLGDPTAKKLAEGMLSKIPNTEP
jgi:hypothetical protein